MLVLLPGLIRSIPGNDRLELFKMIEGRFTFQARLSTLITGITRLYMTYRLEAWDRFTLG